MNDSTFWRLLDELDWNHQGSDERVVAPVLAALTRLPLKEIESFQQILARKLYALDGRSWAREIGSGWWGGTNPLSVDEFLYALSSRRCPIETPSLTLGVNHGHVVDKDGRRLPNREPASGRPVGPWFRARSPS